MIGVFMVSIVAAVTLSGCGVVRDARDSIRDPRSTIPDVAPKTFADFNWLCADNMKTGNWGDDPLKASSDEADCRGERYKFDEAYEQCKSHTGKAYDQCMIPILHADTIRNAERIEARRAARNQKKLQR